MENFTPYASLFGGIIIGLSATVLLTTGKLAGISGILAGLLPPQGKDNLWRVLFIVGLFLGALLFPLVGGDISYIDLNPYQLGETAHIVLLIIGGLLVGGGTYIGAGCTSGHGVCGIGRLSIRSMMATVTFMVTAIVTVFIMRLMVGG